MVWRMVLAVAVAGVSTACLTGRAAAPERPPLTVPEVPPRAVEPALPAEQLQIEPGSSEPAVSPRAPARPTARTADTTQKPDTAKPADSARVEPPPDTPPTTPAPAPQLRLPQMANDAANETQIRQMMDRALKHLGTVRYQDLKAESRAEYDKVQQFKIQVEELIKQRNYPLALQVADKAEKIAKEIAGVR